MLRNQRRWHLRLWLILGPAIIVLAIYALSVRDTSPVYTAKTAEVQP